MMIMEDLMLSASRTAGDKRWMAGTNERTRQKKRLPSSLSDFLHIIIIGYVASLPTSVFFISHLL